MWLVIFAVIVAIIIFLLVCDMAYCAGKETGFKEGKIAAKRDIQQQCKCSECVECTMNQFGWSCRKGHFANLDIKDVINNSCGDIAVKLSNL